MVYVTARAPDVVTVATTVTLDRARGSEPEQHRLADDLACLLDLLEQTHRVLLVASDRTRSSMRERSGTDLSNEYPNPRASPSFTVASNRGQMHGRAWARARSPGAPLAYGVEGPCSKAQALDQLITGIRNRRISRSNTCLPSSHHRGIRIPVLDWYTPRSLRAQHGISRQEDKRPSARGPSHCRLRPRTPVRPDRARSSLPERSCGSDHPTRGSRSWR